MTRAAADGRVRGGGRGGAQAGGPGGGPGGGRAGAGPRRGGPEILDGEVDDPAALRASLAHVDQVNRWLGGERALRAAADSLEDGAAGPLRLLDVGTGSGALPARLLDRRRGPPRRWTVVGLDRHRQILEVARPRAGERGGLHLVRGDALALPFAADAFDAAACTLTLHHFGDADAVRVIREMARVSRRLVVVSDLERHPANLLGARLLARTLWRANPITRHDGPLSVLRSFTADELRALAREAGLRDVRVRRRFFHRLVLTGSP